MHRPYACEGCRGALVFLASVCDAICSRLVCYVVTHVTCDTRVCRVCCAALLLCSGATWRLFGTWWLVCACLHCHRSQLHCWEWSWCNLPGLHALAVLWVRIVTKMCSLAGCCQTERYGHPGSLPGQQYANCVCRRREGLPGWPHHGLVAARGTYVTHHIMLFMHFVEVCQLVCKVL